MAARSSSSPDGPVLPTMTEPATQPITPAHDVRDPGDRIADRLPATLPLHARVPRWIVTSGVTGWLLLGMAGVAAVILWILTYVSALVVPLLGAIVLAILFSPIVDMLERRRIPRGVGATLVSLGVIAFIGALTWIIAKGIIDQAPQIAAQFKDARDALAGWLTDLGLSAPTAQNAMERIAAAGSSTTSALLTGIFSGLAGLTSMLFMAFIGLVIFLFMLLNGRRYAGWAAGHVGQPRALTESVMADFGTAIRGYFRGTTIIAASNAIPVAITAWLLDVPLVGTIAIVTFFTAYVPYFGAIIGSIFVCFIALGSQGLTDALIMLGVILFVNNVLQNFFAPVAYGSTLNLDPLAVLLVTTAAGLIGGVGLIVLAAPIAAVVSQTAKRLTAARQPPDEKAD